MKFYTVSWIENGMLMSKRYKRRKCAERFGREMLEKFGNEIHISTFFGTDIINIERYN